MDALKPEGPRPDAPRVRDDLPVVARRCPFCHEAAQAGDVVACAQCDARLHAACWDEHGACPSCGGQERMVRERKSLPLPQAPRARPVRVAALLLAAGLLLLGLLVFATAQSSQEAHEALAAEREAREADQARREQAEAQDAVTRDLGAELRVTPEGLEVLSVVVDGPAAHARLAPGDVIEAVLAGSVDALDVVYPVRTLDELREALAQVARTPYVRPLLRVRRGAERVRVSLPR
ncbi:MAG: RING finger protein [Planctomycetota bacterium]